MRRLITLGLLALSFGLFSSSVFAGQFEYCEAHKSELRDENVYGICNAWHNADTDEERDKFAQKYFERTGEETLPWDDQPLEIDCPCWVYEEVQNYICSLGPPQVLDFGLIQGSQDTYYGMLQFGSGAASEWFMVSPNLELCAHGFGATPPFADFREVEYAEGALCGFDLGIIHSMHSSVMCD